MVGVKPQFITWKGKDPYGWVVSQNVYRRVLTPSQEATVFDKAGIEPKGKRYRYFDKIKDLKEEMCEKGLELIALLPLIANGSMSIACAKRRVEWLVNGGKEPEKEMALSAACRMFLVALPQLVARDAYETAMGLKNDEEEKRGLEYFWQRIEEGIYGV